MKKAYSFLAFLLLFAQLVMAQSDDKFYYPSTKWQPLDSTLRIEEVNLNAGNDTLSGLFITPAGKPKATILYFHGAGGNVTTYQFAVRPLVENGYQVMLIDFRGYGKSTGKPTHTGIAKDGQLVFEYLLGRQEVKNTPVLILGASIGSQVATRIARDNQHKIAGLILDGAMSSFADIAMVHAPQEQHATIAQSLKIAYNAKDDIVHVCKPVLLVYSKEDKDVPAEMGNTLYKAAPCKKAEYIFTGDHLMGMKVAPAAYVAQVNRFFGL